MATKTQSDPETLIASINDLAFIAKVIARVVRKGWPSPDAEELVEAVERRVAAITKRHTPEGE
jgi:hypothetical protein